MHCRVFLAVERGYNRINSIGTKHGEDLSLLPTSIVAIDQDNVVAVPIQDQLSSLGDGRKDGVRDISYDKTHSARRSRSHVLCGGIRAVT